MGLFDDLIEDIENDNEPQTTQTESCDERDSCDPDCCDPCEDCNCEPDPGTDENDVGNPWEKVWQVRKRVWDASGKEWTA